MSENVLLCNFERTITEEVWYHALADRREAKLPHFSNDTQIPSIKDQRNTWLGWVVQKTPEDIQPLLDVTKKRAVARLAPFARIMFEEWVKVEGNTIGIVSATAPYDFINQYADGYEEAIPSLKDKVSFVFGKNLITDENDHYVGRLGSIKKTVTAESILEEGHNIGATMESFGTAISTMLLGQKQIIVNPDREMQESSWYNQLPHIQWGASTPNRTRVSMPVRHDSAIFNLDKPGDVTVFRQFAQVVLGL